jgi:hypothetical protein
LNGTPILVDVKSKTAMKGSHAISNVNTILKSIHAPEPEENDQSFADALQGMTPDGEKYLHSEPSNQQVVNERPVETRQGKVTDEDLQAYVARRNASNPPGQPSGSS